MNAPAHNQSNAAQRIVVVGAGLAGLTAAMHLNDAGFKVEILEASSEPGGNAWLTTTGGMRQPTAGSCFRFPTPGGVVEDLLTRFKLSGKYHSTSTSMQVLFRTSALLRNLHEVIVSYLRQPRWLLHPKVWGLTGNLLVAGLTGRPLLPASKELGEPIFADLYTFLDRLSPGKGRFPSVPWGPECGISRDEMMALDQMTIRQFFFDPEMTRHLPNDLQPPRRLGQLVRLALTTTLEVEGLLLDNCSAYVGLYFLVGYLYGDLVALSGGNGAVSEALINHLRTQSAVNIQTESKVDRIDHDGSAYRVEFTHADQQETLSCQGVVVATPKHTALGMFTDLPEEQKAAIREIEYSDYAIANARLRDPVWTKYFGAYFIGDTPDAAAKAGFCKAGGVVNSTWEAFGDNQGIGGFSILKPVAARKGQGQMTSVNLSVLRNEAETEVRRILAAIGANPDILEDVTLHVWPQGLVSPRPGQIARRVFETASAPFGAITFANQDSIGVGCLESAVESGAFAAHQIARILNQNSIPRCEVTK